MPRAHKVLMQLCSQGGQGQDGVGDSRQNSASSSSLSKIPVPGAQDGGGVGGQCLLVTALSRPYSPELGCLLAGGALVLFAFISLG